MENLVFDPNVEVQRIVVTAGETLKMGGTGTDGHYLLVLSGSARVLGDDGEQVFHETDMIDATQGGAHHVTSDAADGPLILLAVKTV